MNFKKLGAILLAAAMLLAMCACGKAKPIVYTDVNSSSWYAKYVELATGVGIATGYDDGTFLRRWGIEAESEAWVIRENGVAVGLIDFDTIHPAPALWDLAYAVYRWAPLFSTGHQGGVFDQETQLRRARIFCDAYGATADERRRLPAMIVERLRALVAFMRGRAEAGDETFVEDVEAGEAALYLADIAHMDRLGERLGEALLGSCSHASA